MSTHWISRRAALLAAAMAFLWLNDLCVAAEDKTKDDKPAQPGAGPYGGWGKNATGGAGKPSVEAGTFQELSDALKKGNATILVKADIVFPKNAPFECIETTAGNMTLDGQGHTFWGDELPQGGRLNLHMLKFVGGKNIIIKNLRIRNSGGGNLCFYQGASDIVIDHVSSTGCGNKAIAVEGSTKVKGSGSFNATITHCFMAGNTRSLFFKYGGTHNITMDHNVVIKFHMRSPLADDVDGLDVRNNLIMDWNVIGTRLSGNNCNGNVMGNIYVSQKDHKDSNKAILFAGSEPKLPVTIGKVHIADNVFRKCAQEPKTKQTADKPLDTPAILPAYTTDLDKLEKALLSETDGAGCMPRDAADKAYLAAKTWTVSYGTPFRVPEALLANSGKASDKDKDRGSNKQK